MTFRQKYLYGEGSIELNAGRRTLTLTVSNTGDRAVQVGSHYHFFEVNSALSFDRQKTLGMHLNIPAGTSVRIEPGGSREVELCAYAGTGRLVGFSGLLNGSLASHPAKVEAVRKAVERGFEGAEGPRRTWADDSETKSKATPAAKKGKADSAASTEPAGNSRAAHSATDKKKGSR
ncbi:urease subunit beta [Streptomyces tsukubensis]|uniref:Urease subunit beta n=1 Tax=Streptomyces tsukubensis TaxID=83656 RepID=A0A1V3ZYL9_9ACTN|nr:urease subunit beta [Streptomyces tsukubensis]OON71472.1 urease subunit beta [Streptomyces tsukubensis]QFR96992.1 urease subunit beta [Streptomyces tsukubensis]